MNDDALIYYFQQVAKVNPKSDLIAIKLRDSEGNETQWLTLNIECFNAFAVFYANRLEGVLE